MQSTHLQLRPYQREDVDRMWSILNEHGSCLNLSEMRCGKLVEFIELCRRKLAGENCGAVLVVAPLSTLWNVRDEFARWLGWTVHVNPPNEQAAHPRKVGQPVIVAINKEALRDLDHWVFTSYWDLVLLDEAHHYRGRNTQQTKGAFKLARNAGAIVMATGTPLMNGRPKELWPLLHLLDRKQWPHFWPYMKGYAADIPSPVGPYQDENAPWRKGARPLLQASIALYVVRRTYKEVYPELPDVIEQTIPLQLADVDPDHYRAYKELEQEWLTTIGDQQVEVMTKLALTMRLRQLAASPLNLGAKEPGGKVKAIVDYLENVPSKVVVWCWHKSMVAGLASALKRSPAGERGLILTVTGDDRLDERQLACQFFQGASTDQPNGCPTLVATIGALKEGITLDTAQVAIFAEKSWVPAENDQAAARILGPNQQGAPLVVSFVCEDTIEAKIERVLADKSAICNDFLMFTKLTQGAN